MSERNAAAGTWRVSGAIHGVIVLGMLLGGAGVGGAAGSKSRIRARDTENTHRGRRR